ncbi:MAG: lytic murein transglycosylase [Parcubacteria group bacterium]|nr:lytic murein transglycosylase [Parcubacteria group bacterium]
MQIRRRQTASFLEHIFLASVALGIFFGSVCVVYAQATGDDVRARRAQLEEDLATLESQIEAQQAILEEKQRETVSLERDIAIIDARIQSAELSIRARDLTIKKLGTEIGGKETLIDDLSEKLNREKQSLAQLLRKTREMDTYSLAEVVLANKNLSEFFSDINSFNAIQAGLNSSFKEITATKEKTQEEKTTLEDRRKEEEELRRIQDLQKRRIEEDKAQKREILKISKGQEAVYKNIIDTIQKDAAAIRIELFILQGTDAISFERALELANIASQKTGVRPALILGVIAEESNLGENVGQCVLTNQPNKGDGKGINTGRSFRGVMKASRDVDIFFNITEKLGINPYGQVVSCPPRYGYGGAMGPAQFIPSTWVLFEERIAKLTGHNPPNPWDPHDAFIAAALLLKDSGAAALTHTAERRAVLRYFAGGNWNKSAYAFYGNDIVGGYAGDPNSLAGKYQRQIDILQQN